MKLSVIEKLLDDKLKKVTAEPWDNCGLLIGRRNHGIKGILLALELTEEILKEAKMNHCDLIITHHPVIFGGVQQILEDEQKLIYHAIKNDIAVYSAHTNFDMIKDGLNDYVCSLLGARNISVLPEDETGIIRLFDIDKSSASEFSRFLMEKLQVQDIRLIGSAHKDIRRVGLVTGSGVSYAKTAFENGADLFITGDIKYHEAMDYAQNRQVLIDAGHFGTEKHFKDAMLYFIESHIKALSGLKIIKSQMEMDPFNNLSSNHIKLDDTRLDDTRLDGTMLDGTRLDNTRLDNTRLDGTMLDDTRLDEIKTEQTKGREEKLGLKSKEKHEQKLEQTYNLKDIEIYTDGGSRGNPGDAAIGFIIKSQDQVIYQYGQTIGIQTNNVAEYQAVLAALKKAKSLGIQNFKLYLDSQLVERQLNGTYKVKNEDLKVIYEQIVLELKEFKGYKITHIGREMNTLADKLVNMALDQDQTIEIKEI